MIKTSYYFGKGLKKSIADLNLYDLPMVGIFRDKEYMAYTLSTLADIEVEDLDDMEVSVEDFLQNAQEGRRDMRMDARVNIKKGKERASVEIQRIRKDDEAARALNYAGALVTDFEKGLQRIPECKNTVIFICDFDPFKGTPYSGQTRMKFVLKSDDDESQIHTLTGKPYPFDGLTIIVYNGSQDWKKNPPKSEKEEKIMVYLQDMKNTDPGKMTSKIASTACRKYKGDPTIVDKVKDWIVYKYGEHIEAELEAQRKVHEKEIEALKEWNKLQKEESQKREKELMEEASKREEALKEEAFKREKELLHKNSIQMAEVLLSSTSMSISEVAKISGLGISEVEILASRLRANK